MKKGKSKHYDTLDKMLYQVAAECCKKDVAEFDAIDSSTVSFDDGFYVKRDQVISECRQRTAVKRLKRVSSKIAIAIASALVVGLLSVMAIAPLREALFNAIIEWYENYIAIRYDRADNGEESATDNSGDSSVEGVNGTEAEYSSAGQSAVMMADADAVQTRVVPTATTIEEIKKPALLPYGVEEKVVAESCTAICIHYYVNEISMYTFHQMAPEVVGKFIDNDAVAIGMVDINGNSGYIFEQADKSVISIIWNDDKYTYQIYSKYMDIDFLVAIAETVG